MMYLPVSKIGTFLRPISISFHVNKDIKKHILHGKFLSNLFKTVVNSSHSKSISDSGLWCIAGSNDRERLGDF